MIVSVKSTRQCFTSNQKMILNHRWQYNSVKSVSLFPYKLPLKVQLKHDCVTKRNQDNKKVTFEILLKLFTFAPAPISEKGWKLKIKVMVKFPIYSLAMKSYLNDLVHEVDKHVDSNYVDFFLWNELVHKLRGWHTRGNPRMLTFCR